VPPVLPPLVVELAEIHKPLIQKHLLDLSNEDRRLRFGAAVGPMVIGRYLSSLDFEDDVTLGVINDDDELIGFGHLVLTSPIPEFGISISASARGRGLGNLLLARACRHVRLAGATQLAMHYLPENTALAQLANRAGMRLSVRHGEGIALLSLPPLEDAEPTISHEIASALDLAFRLAQLRSRAAATSA
jgi:GNAT superfamily N-acetyltransferase